MLESLSNADASTGTRSLRTFCHPTPPLHSLSPQELQRQGSPSLVLALVGNKADLIESRATTEEEAKQFASSNGMLYFETSAKTNNNVTELFYAIAHGLPKTEPKSASSNNGGISLRGAPPQQKQKSACC